MTATLLPHHLELGAHFGSGAGAEAVLDYGDVEAEYRSVRAAAGMVERSDLRICRMHGRDPVRMLNGLITNDLTKVAAGRAVYGAMLTPKGRMITDVRVDSIGTELLFDFPAVATEGLSDHLRKYMPPMFARWEILAGWSVIGVYGPASEAAVSAALGIAVSGKEDEVVAAEIEGGSLLCVGSAYAGGELGVDIIAPNEILATVWSKLVNAGSTAGVLPIGMSALEKLRVEGGRPRYGCELTEETIPAEAYESTGLMPRAISFNKGCYTGQEVVVRIAHRGHVNRNLRGLVLDGENIPSSRAPVTRAGKEVGWVTSAVRSPLVGRSIALAYVRREIGPGDVVEAGGTSATVVELPFRATKAG